jgi:hypothetical protein
MVRKHLKCAHMLYATPKRVPLSDVLLVFGRNLQVDDKITIADFERREYQEHRWDKVDDTFVF